MNTKTHEKLKYCVGFVSVRAGFWNSAVI